MPRRLLSSCFAATIFAAFCLACTNVTYGQNSAGPQPVALPAPVPPPVDKAYGRTISLSVDLTNVNDRVLNVHETIPVKSGEITLLYPQWLPGNHAPSNPIAFLAGLVLTADGKRISWVRDRVNMWAFHVDVPNGVTSLEVNFQYVAPVNPQLGRISNKFADLTWNSVLLYPAGHFSRRIQFAPELRLPEGWKFATALEVKSQNGNTVQFKDVPLNTVDRLPGLRGCQFQAR